MKARIWQIVALTLIAGAIAFVMFGTLVEHAPDNFGVKYRIDSQNGTAVVLRVEPGSSAQRGGIRPGDRIAFPTSPGQSANLLYPNVGTHVVVRVNGSRSVSLVEQKSRPASLPIPITVIRLAFLLVAALLAWRRPRDRCVRWLVVFLGCYGLGLALANDALPTPMLSVIFLQAGSLTLQLTGTGAAAIFAATFPSGIEPPAARILSRAAMALAVMTVIYAVSATITPLSSVLSLAQRSEIGALAFLAVIALAVATLIAAYAQGAPIDRARRKWVFAIIVVGLLGPLVDIAVQSIFGFQPVVDEFSILPLAVIPIGLAYVILRHRVLDIGFVVNRAVVYAGVSIVIVGLFVLLESLLARALENQSHATGLVAQLIVALALGFSIRFVHARVDRLVDTVLFRERHRAETAMREFAHDAVYISELDILLQRCVETVMRYAYATGAGVWLRDERGNYRRSEGTFDTPAIIGENDPAILAMRARHVIVTLPDTASALPGLLAFPMIVRGELVGALICAAKFGHEAYAPDERDALESIATAVGHAVDALAVAQLKRQLETLLRPATVT